MAPSETLLSQLSDIAVRTVDARTAQGLSASPGANSRFPRFHQEAPRPVA